LPRLYVIPVEAQIVQASDSGPKSLLM